MHLTAPFKLPGHRAPGRPASASQLRPDHPLAPGLLVALTLAVAGLGFAVTVNARSVDLSATNNGGPALIGFEVVHASS